MSGFIPGPSGGASNTKAYGVVNAAGAVDATRASAGITSIVVDPTPFYTVDITAAGFTNPPVVLSLLDITTNLQNTYYPTVSLVTATSFRLTIIDPSSGQVANGFQFACVGT